jgi:UDP-N-acetylglucosamine 2-epimerase (non-hydrolysing)
MKRILLVVGARPNFMKVAPIVHALAAAGDEFVQTLVHTGQHYDANMSQVFFEELGMPRPDVNLEVGSGTHAFQTAEVMKRFEPVLIEHRPDWLLVPGDVNSTLACALVASKIGIPVAHLEAGLRSYDRTMPEEINRLLTDQISDLLLIPSLDARKNLIKEGVLKNKIHFVGNAMIDTLVRLLPAARKRLEPLLTLYGLGCNFVLVTLHRPSNVDDPASLRSILLGLNDLAGHIPVVFSVHPRTRQRIADEGLGPATSRLKLTEALGYLDFLALESEAALVITDSGGVQEETTFLGVPCLTVRPNTERPITIFQGTNQLVPSSREALFTSASRCIRDHRTAKHRIPPLWDGHAAGRVVEVLRRVSAGTQ